MKNHGGKNAMNENTRNRDKGAAARRANAPTGTGKAKGLPDNDWKAVPKGVGTRTIGGVP
jgi:hypothetical protein